MARTRATNNKPLTKSEELEIFRKTSAQLVARAKKDRAFALRLLEKVGHFDMPPVDDNGEPLTPTSQNGSGRKY